MGISQSFISRRKVITFPPPDGVITRRRRPLRWLTGKHSGGRENKSWLLADTEPSETEPHSVHSSFRFSFGSQADADASSNSPPAAAAVLLLVTMEDESQKQVDSKLPEQWRRLEPLERLIAPAVGGLVRFSYAQIRSATRDFHKGRELGRGALSRVYKGRLGRGLRKPAVAVKRVDGPERESAKAFCRELLIASSLCSPHVVPLIGYCVEEEGLFLVYKYVSGGSLDRHLHQNEKVKGGKVLSWRVRYKVAVGMAQAVEYLHFGEVKCVVHRDVKSSNVLLSRRRNPMICDFGLATWTHGPSIPFLCKEVKGTFGYLAPEYFQNGKLSDKTDVYAFGVVLLELITGRKALDQSKPQGDENLVLWAKPLLVLGEDAIEKLADPRLMPSSYNGREMRRMVRAANACLSCDDSTRPSIDRVLAMLLDEDDACYERSLLSCNGGPVGYDSRVRGQEDRGDMGGHLALAMLGVSDNEDDYFYRR